MKKILYILAAVAMMFTSCSKDDNGTDPDTGGTTAGGGDITFQIGIGEQVQTKVATDADFKSDFEQGDQIGIFAVRRASGETKTLATSGNYIHNVKLTYSTADGGKWTTTSELWHATGSDVLDFYAYYPYNDNGSSPSTLDPTAITFNVMADQSTALNYGNSDLLSAKLTGVARGTAVTLTFAHQLSLVQVEVDPGTIKGSGPSDHLTLTLRGCKAGATLNLGATTNAIAVLGDAAAVKMLRVESDPATATTYTYRALVPAQSVASGTNLCLMAQNGQLYNTPTLAAPLALTAGDAKRYTAKLPSTALQTVKIPKGTFLMGSSDGSNIGDGAGTGLNTTPEEPDRQSNETQHEVTLTKDFYMSKYVITNAQYAAFLNANSIGSDGKWTGDIEGVIDPRLIRTHDWGVQRDGTNNKWIPATGKDNFPVINVTWYGAKAYADWIGGSLPTEAQWEYACRAGTTTPFSLGTAGGGNSFVSTQGNFWWSDPYDVSQNGNYSDNTKIPLKKTQPVGSYAPNAWGLYDMHGNVWELCNDRYGTYTTGDATDPTGPATGSNRVLRGGSWLDDAQDCRSAYRNYVNPDFANGNIGFRVVLVP